jgi:intein/homing endonuclease
MIKNEEIEKLKKDIIFKPLNSKEELRDWLYLYFDILYPMGFVHPTSTHGPVDAMWRIYELFKTGETKKVPQVVMVASRDSFKCQAKGSKLITKEGVKKIEDIKVEDVVWTGFSWQKVTNLIDDGIKNGIKITTYRNYEFTGSPIHKYWSLRDGVEQWIESKDLDPERDLICINNNIDRDLSIDQEKYDLGYFLGILIGDGSLSFLEYEKGASFFALTTVDEYIKKFFFDFCERKWNYTPRSCGDKITYRVCKKDAVQFLLKTCGVKKSLSHQKTIPDIVWTDTSMSIGFINGVFDTDGTFEKSKKNALFSMSAETLLKEMQTLLLSLGVVSSFRKAKKLVEFKDKNLKQNHLTCHLTVNAHELIKFQKIGFTNKSLKANKIHIPQIPDAHDIIPWSHLGFLLDVLKFKKNTRKTIGRKHKTKVNLYRSTAYKGLNVDKISHFILWAEETIELGGYETKDVPAVKECISRLKSLIKNKWLPFTKENVENVHFYDLTVENDHCYWSNGSISHNTLSAAAIEVLLFLHFKLPLAHAAAIKFQAGACVNYVNTMFRRVRPYLEAHGWTKTSDNKTLIEWRTPEGDDISLTVLTATKEGFNSRHCPLMVLDELDLMDAGAFQESRMVPSMYKGIHPLTIILSTRKFASGLMENQIALTPKIGGEVYRWNIVDVTERITPEVAQIDKPKVVRYVTSDLPMQNISEDDWKALPDKQKNKFERFEAYAGVAEHPLLPVMRHYLVHRPQEDHGFLYKPVEAVLNNFKGTTPEFASAQLLCEKPSSAGLVYPRFDSQLNTLTVPKLWEKVTGNENPHVTYEQLRDFLIKLGCTFIGGGDFGFSDSTALVVLCILPGGHIVLVDSFIAPNLEPEDVVKQMLEMNEKWGVDKWFTDQNRPDIIKTFVRKGGKAPKFDKDVAEGIGALQSKIVDSNGVRRFFVLNIPDNQFVMDMFANYKWSLDAKGEIVEGKPYHDRDGISDMADSIRYPFQNLYGNSKKISFTTVQSDPALNKPKPIPNQSLEEIAKQTNQTLMKEKINELVPETNRQPEKKKGTKKVLWM